jgi:hypothetical protein
LVNFHHDGQALRAVVVVESQLPLDHIEYLVYALYDVVLRTLYRKYFVV